MDAAADSPKMEVWSAKRARHEDLDTAQLAGSSHPAEAVVPANKQPPMYTKALRSVLKGVRRYVWLMPAHTLQFTYYLVCMQFLLSRRVSIEDGAS